MDDIYEKALYNGYGLRLYNASRTRRGLVCKTDKGYMSLRKVQNDGKTIIFENSIKKRLYDNGFTGTDLYYNSVDGKPYYVIGDNTFVLSDFVETSDIDEEDPDTIKKVSAAMAVMHKLSKGVEADGNVSLGKLPKTWQKRKAELKRIKKRINSVSNYSPVDIIIIKNYEYFIERTERAQEFLNSTAYSLIAKEAAQARSVCHNNFKGDNVRFKAGGESLYITGFEKSSYDCRAADIAAYIRRCMKSEKCSAETVESIITAYNGESTLSGDEIKVIGAMVLFPQKFYKICSESFNKRRVCESDAVVEKLSRCIALSEKEERILEALGMV
ncbi:CotS family spore coat protein [Anaerotignum faecicola]|nr:CotS family spore coat protein [Anaerotignum faecicola]